MTGRRTRIIKGTRTKRRQRVNAISLLSLALVLLPWPVFAEKASDKMMADSEFSFFLRMPEKKRKQRLAENFEELRQLAATSPGKVRAAAVYFETGQSYRELHELRENFGIEVVDARLKAPQGDRGQVMTIGGGMADLLASDGTFEQRLEYMITQQQKCFGRMARVMPPDESREMLELANRPFAVYSARIFGPASALAEIQQEPYVRAVVLSPDRKLIDQFEWMKAEDRPHRYDFPEFSC